MEEGGVRVGINTNLEHSKTQLSKKEISISKEFEKKGYLVKDITDIQSLTKIRKIFVNSIKKKYFS